MVYEEEVREFVSHPVAKTKAFMGGDWGMRDELGTYFRSQPSATSTLRPE